MQQVRVGTMIDDSDKIHMPGFLRGVWVQVVPCVAIGSREQNCPVLLEGEQLVYFLSPVRN